MDWHPLTHGEKVQSESGSNIAETRRLAMDVMGYSLNFIFLIFLTWLKHVFPTAAIVARLMHLNWEGWESRPQLIDICSLLTSSIENFRHCNFKTRSSGTVFRNVCWMNLFWGEKTNTGHYIVTVMSMILRKLYALNSLECLSWHIRLIPKSILNSKLSKQLNRKAAYWETLSLFFFPLDYVCIYTTGYIM